MKRVAAIAMISAGALIVSCEGGATEATHYKSGPAGQVVEREQNGDTFELETKDLKGKRHEFNVTPSVYNDCQLYSNYPACVKTAQKKSDKFKKPGKKKVHKKRRK